MSEQIKGFWLKNLLKGKVWILGALVLILNVACGGGGGGDAATPSPMGTGTPATPPSTPPSSPSTPATPATPPPVAGIKVPKELDVVRVK
tara:strand:+ start:1962 stop:2231 length:270 start_codon:yes stop_codon:yes gene_type:complete